MFSTTKCKMPTCEICKPPHLTLEVLHDLCHIPDPLPAVEGEKYKNFESMYEGSTTEEFCPSFSLGTKPGGHGMPFLLVNNMLKNVKVVMQCSECSSKWRLCKAAIETKPV